MGAGHDAKTGRLGLIWEVPGTRVQLGKAFPVGTDGIVEQGFLVLTYCLGRFYLQ